MPPPRPRAPGVRSHHQPSRHRVPVPCMGVRTGWTPPGRSSLQAPDFHRPRPRGIAARGRQRVARLAVRQPFGHRPTLRSACRQSGRTAERSSPGAVGAGGDPRLRGGGQLEDRRGELSRVLSLHEHPPGALPGHAALERRQLRADRPVGRRLHGPHATRQDHVDQRREPGRFPPWARRGLPPSGLLLRDVPDIPDQPAPGLRADASPRAADAGPNPHRVPVAVPGGGDGAA